MSIEPPSGIASRALIARLRIASSSWLASIRAGGRPSGISSRNATRGPSERSSRLTMPWISARRSTGTARKSCWRAKASRRWVSDAPRSAPCSAPSTSRCRRGSSGQALAQQIEIAHHRHQQIVEIVRDAAGELADGLHLLRLPQLLLRLFAGGDFLHQIGGALLDALLQGRGQFGQRRALGGQLRQQVLALDFGGLARGDIGANADQRLDAAVGRRTARARTSTQCSEPSGQILRYSML